jgi:hypothetical protein
MAFRAHARTRAAAVAALASFLAAAGVSAAAGGDTQVVRMKRVQAINDNPDNGAVGKVHYEVLVPIDWKFESKLVVSGCMQDLEWLSFRAQNADGTLAVGKAPDFSWHYSDNGFLQYVFQGQTRNTTGRKGCEVGGPLPAADLLRKVVLPKLRPGKTVVSVEPYPEFEQIARAQVGLPPRAGSGWSPPSPGRPSVDAARARLRYELDGRPVEEWVTAVTISQATPAGGGQPGQRPPMTYNSHAGMLFAMRAPQGQLEANEKLLKTVALSVRRDPAWGRQLDANIDHYQQLVDEDNIRTVNRMVAARNRLEWQIVGARLESSARLSEAAHAGFSAADQNILGVQSFQNPSTGSTVQLSNQYGHAWSNGDGSQYVVTNDPDYDPNSDPNRSGNWTRLQYVDPK